MRNVKKLIFLILSINIIFMVSSCNKNSSNSVEEVMVENKEDTKEIQTDGNSSKNINVTLPIIPPSVTEEGTGYLVDLVKAMSEEYTDGELTFNIFPFPRSIDNILSGKADVHLPFLKKHEITDSDDNFYYSSETFYEVIFVLYTNKDVESLTPENVTDKKFKVEVQDGHTEYLKNLNEVNIEAGLQKVNSGRIDGYICAMETGDVIMKNLELENINRQEYDSFEAKMIFPKTDKGKKIEEIMSGLLKKVKDNGKHSEILKDILKVNEKFIPDSDS